MPTKQRCRRSRRPHETDRHWLIAVAAHAAVEGGLALIGRRLALSAPRPAVEVAWIALHLLAAELVAHAIVRRRR